MNRYPGQKWTKRKSVANEVLSLRVSQMVSERRMFCYREMSYHYRVDCRVTFAIFDG